VLIPRPKSVVAGAGTCAFPATPACVVTGAAGESRRLRAALADLGFRTVERLPGREHGVTVALGRPTGTRASEWARNAEGYRLRVTPAGARVEATTAQGAFYGIETLAQCLRERSNGTEAAVVTIEDWPSMRFRGAHWFPSVSGVTLDRRPISRIMAPFKMNLAVIQCEAARWDSHPEIAAPNSVAKKDLAGLVALCRRSFIEPVPLIASPGHGDWMFRNGKNLDFCEDPKRPYACCINHPRSQVFLTEIMGEALELFRPRYVHLGHDEVRLRGRFPNPDCPSCGKQTETRLVLKHLGHLSTWLAKRGIKPLVWGDMLLAPAEASGGGAHAPNPAEARLRRAGLPAGTVVADWHYQIVDDYPSLELLRREKRPAIACSWYRTENIRRLAAAARKAGSLGLVQTTWAGYFPDESVLGGNEIRQYSAFILAAEYAWSGRDDPPDALGYKPRAVFQRAYGLE
jgi:hexosaminidase